MEPLKFDNSRYVLYGKFCQFLTREFGDVEVHTRAFSLLLYSFSPPSAERVNGPSPGANFAAMREPFGNEVFFSRFDGYTSAINDQGIATLDHDHVFVVLMHVRR
jgi:hypothetical protein